MSLKTKQCFTRIHGSKHCYRGDNSKVSETNLISSTLYEPNDHREFTPFSEPPFPHLYNLDFRIYFQDFLSQECVIACYSLTLTQYYILDFYCITMQDP